MKRIYTSYKEFKYSRRYRYIDGSSLGPNSKPKGYCWCDTHKGYLSKILIQKHKCEKKNCQFYEKFKQEGVN